MIVRAHFRKNGLSQNRLAYLLGLSGRNRRLDTT